MTIPNDPASPWGDYDDETFPLRVILLFRADGGWHLSAALCRDGDEPPSYVGGWNEPWSDRGLEDDWRYLEERIVEGRYGNGHTFELKGYRVRSMADAERVALAEAAEAVAATGGPLGDPVGTFATDDDGGAVWMPFVVLVDDGVVRLVGTAALPEKPVLVTGPHGQVESETYQSVEHWQRNGERAWKVSPDVEYHLWWADGEAYLRVAQDGRFLRLANEPATPNPEEDPEPDHPVRVFRLTATPPGADRLAEHTTSDDSLWGWAIPMVMRTAAGPTWDARWPAVPDRTDPDAAYGYWAALHHLLQYSFGWRRPDRGMRWWYDAGHPTADRRLRLIAETYLDDGQLDWYVAWLCRWYENTRSYHQTVLHGLAGAADDGVPVDVDPDWLDAQETTAAASGVPNPLTPDNDSLHLTSHAGGPVAEIGGAVELRRSGRAGRSGVLLCDSAMGWYRALFEESSRLPSIDDPRWRIDIVIKPIGWVGTYRRSPKEDVPLIVELGWASGVIIRVCCDGFGVQLATAIRWGSPSGRVAA